MENVVSNAERRALLGSEQVAVPRVTDVYAALPSITGKFEMEYEGELKGAETIGRELIRAAVANVADGYLAHLETRQVIEWFDLGGSLQLGDLMSAADVLKHAREVQGLVELAHAAGIPAKASPQLLASGIDFVLEGLYAHEEDRAQRRARVPRDGNAGPAPDARAVVQRRDADPDGRGKEEVLQLTLIDEPDR